MNKLPPSRAQTHRALREMVSERCGWRGSLQESYWRNHIDNDGNGSYVGGDEWASTGKILNEQDCRGQKHDLLIELIISLRAKRKKQGGRKQSKSLVGGSLVWASFYHSTQEHTTKWLYHAWHASRRGCKHCAPVQYIDGSAVVIKRNIISSKPLYFSPINIFITHLPTQVDILSIQRIESIDYIHHWLHSNSIPNTLKRALPPSSSLSPRNSLSINPQFPLLTKYPFPGAIPNVTLTIPEYSPSEHVASGVSARKHWVPGAKAP
jgi:hypothetical protein